jgi:hypothetical protein
MFVRVFDFPSAPVLMSPSFVAGIDSWPDVDFVELAFCVCVLITLFFHNNCDI